MSYNISTWRTDECSLALSIEAANGYGLRVRRSGVTLDSEDWAAEVCDIKGVIENNEFRIKDIDIHGECSGTAWDEEIVPFLKQTTGHLKALLVWAGGDTVEWLHVKDGEITTKKI